MSFIDHLEELRRSIINIIIILAVGFFAAYGFAEQISEFLLDPLRKALALSNGKVIYLGLFDKVVSELQLAGWAGVILTSPLWFFQVWKFIEPGLYDHEKKAVKPFIFLGFTLFCAGICFGYFLVFPFFFKLLMEYGVQGVEANIALKEYIITAVKVLVFLGFIFQVPNILLILGMMGIVTKHTLRSFRRYIYVILAVFAAIFSPPDVFSMMAVWIPLCILYELGIIAVAWIVHPYLAQKYR